MGRYKPFWVYACQHKIHASLSASRVARKANEILVECNHQLPGLQQRIIHAPMDRLGDSNRCEGCGAALKSYSAVPEKCLNRTGLWWCHDGALVFSSAVTRPLEPLIANGRTKPATVPALSEGQHGMHISGYRT